MRAIVVIAEMRNVLLCLDPLIYREILLSLPFENSGKTGSSCDRAEQQDQGSGQSRNVPLSAAHYPQ
jgi:hypothetical protein